MYGYLFIIILIVVAFYLWNSSSSGNYSELINKIKEGDTNIGTEDPMKDYINLRQIFNFNKEVTKDDIEKLEVKLT